MTLQSCYFSRFISKGHVNSITVIQFLSRIIMSGLERYISAFVSFGLVLLNRVLGHSYPLISVYSLQVSKAIATRLLAIVWMIESCRHSYCLRAAVQ